MGPGSYPVAVTAADAPPYATATYSSLDATCLVAGFTDGASGTVNLQTVSASRHRELRLDPAYRGSHPGDVLGPRLRRAGRPRRRAAVWIVSIPRRARVLLQISADYGEYPHTANAARTPPSSQKSSWP